MSGIQVRRNSRFTISPEAFILDKRVSDRAFRAWHVLDRIAGKNPHAVIDRRTLADALDCSLPSLDRATRELCDLGWMTREREAAGGVCVYTLNDEPVDNAEGVITGEDTPLSPVTTGVVTGDEIALSTTETGGRPLSTALDAWAAAWASTLGGKPPSGTKRTASNVLAELATLDYDETVLIAAAAAAGAAGKPFVADFLGQSGPARLNQVRRQPPRRDQECETHSGQWADNCGACRADRIAVER